MSPALERTNFENFAAIMSQAEGLVFSVGAAVYWPRRFYYPITPSTELCVQKRPGELCKNSTICLIACKPGFLPRTPGGGGPSREG